MTQKNNFPAAAGYRLTFIKPVLIGAGIGLALIALFLSGVNNPNSEWGEYWMARPFIVVPIGGGIGGGFFYLMYRMGLHGMLNRTLATIIGILGFVVVLWMGSVFGLAGTLWN